MKTNKKLYLATYNIVLHYAPVEETSLPKDIQELVRDNAGLLFAIDKVTPIASLSDLPMGWSQDDYPIVDCDGALADFSIEQIIEQESVEALHAEVIELRQRVKVLEAAAIKSAKTKLLTPAGSPHKGTKKK